MIAVLGMMVAGRLASLLVYQMTWRHGAADGPCRTSAVVSLLAKPGWWPLHLAMVWPVTGMSWNDLPAIHLFSTAAAIFLTLGAIGRLGCDERGCFFMADRAFSLLLALCVPFSPAFLYPALVAACCLQYTVAAWPLGPGYSNLLGHEFMRGSLCVASAALAIGGWTGTHHESAMLAAVIAWQASTYVDHALAKCALGPQWHSWIRENRLHCLIANAWLRGWKASSNRDGILSLAAFVARWRVALCAAAWGIEISWLLILADSRLACAILAATIVFHATVFWLTGLLAWHYLANHLVLLALILSGGIDGGFLADHWSGALAGIALSAIWVGMTRSRLLANYRRHGGPRRWGLLADPADHLMAWWDTPLMRMFSYRVTTLSGRVFDLPVTKLSPHDTSLTDLHTHLMILGLHPSLDPEVPADRELARTGVWGLAIDRETRDFLYHTMDGRARLPDRWFLQETQPWRCGGAGAGLIAAKPLHAMFHAMNRLNGKPWHHFMMRWPHFPGEDLAPDVCPLVSPALPEFRFDEPIATITLWRVRTFYDGRNLQLISHQHLGEIHPRNTT